MNLDESKIVSVVERRDTPITYETWLTICEEPQFWDLVADGKLKVSQGSPRQVVLSGTSYVGRAAVGPFIVDIQPKVPGAIQSLMALAYDSEIEVSKQEGPRTELGPLIGFLAARFVDRVERYASDGRDWTYVQPLQTGVRAGGRLDIRATARFRARGVRHMLAFRRQVISHATSLNQIVLAALREVEALAAFGYVSDSDLQRARGMSFIFEDAINADILAGPSLRLGELANQIAQEPGTLGHGEMCALASILLANESFEPTTLLGTTMPWTWFLNLETLFERAVRSLLAVGLPSEISITKGSDDPPPIFSDTGLYSANPDLVLRKNGGALAVGDVKYKDLAINPKSPDVYQLLSHASAFSVQKAFLIYPGEKASVSSLGMASTGCQVSAIVVDISRMETVTAQVGELIGPAECSPGGPLSIAANIFG